MFCLFALGNFLLLIYF